MTNNYNSLRLALIQTMTAEALALTVREDEDKVVKTIKDRINGCEDNELYDLAVQEGFIDPEPQDIAVI
jgi:DNA-binding protein Fis